MNDKSKEQLLKETYDYYWMSALDSSYSLDDIDKYFTKNVMGFGTPIDEKIFSIKDVLALIIRQREQSVDIEMSHAIKPVFHHVITDGNAAVFVEGEGSTFVVKLPI